MATFEKAIRVEGSGGTYDAELDPQWTIGDNPHGGYLLALMARAALAELAAGGGAAHPHPLAANAVFLTPPKVGPVRVEVEPLRVGRAASQIRARLVQGDRPHVDATFTLGLLEVDAEPVWSDAPPVEVAPADECRRTPLVPRHGVRVGMADMIDQRLDLASMTVAGTGAGAETGPIPLPGEHEGSGEIRGWLRFADGTPFDPVSLLYAADGFPPSTMTLGSVGWVPTLTLTVYVRAIPAPGALRVRQRARVVTGSFVDQVCEIWDERGRVVAQATQLAAVRLGTAQRS